MSFNGLVIHTLQDMHITNMNQRATRIMRYFFEFFFVNIASNINSLSLYILYLFCMFGSNLILKTLVYLN